MYRARGGQRHGSNRFKRQCAQHSGRISGLKNVGRRRVEQQCAVRERVAPTARRHVGRIRFEHPGVLGNFSEMAPNAQAPRVSRRAAETKFEAELEKTFTLLVGAVKGVYCAARRHAAAQVHEYARSAFSHVYRCGQRIVTCNREALGKYRLRMRLVLTRHEAVEPDFADADKEGVFERSFDFGAQPRKRRLVGVLHKKGVDAKKIAEPPGMRESARGRPVAGRPRRKKH